MGTQAVGHPYDLFLVRFKPKKDIFGDFADTFMDLGRSMKRGTIMV